MCVYETVISLLLGAQPLCGNAEPPHPLSHFKMSWTSNFSGSRVRGASPRGPSRWTLFRLFRRRLLMGLANFVCVFAVPLLMRGCRFSKRGCRSHLRNCFWYYLWVAWVNFDIRVVRLRPIGNQFYYHRSAGWNFNDVRGFEHLLMCSRARTQSGFDWNYVISGAAIATRGLWLFCNAAFVLMKCRGAWTSTHF